MGSTVHILGKHNLDTSNAQNLAKDLSLRLNANVKYGYYDQFSFDWDGVECEPSLEYICLGEINKAHASKTLFLTDEFYFYHIVYQKYGKQVFQLPYFKQSKLGREDLALILFCEKYELICEDTNDDYGAIYKDTYWNMYNFGWNRWWSLCDSLTVEDTDGQMLKHTQQSRQEIMEFHKTIGGDKVVYLNSQGETEYLTCGFYGWQQILAELNRNFKDTTLLLSDWMKTKKRYPAERYPLAFYDDFADLK